MQRIALKILLGVLPLLIGSVPQVHAQSAMYATSGGGRTGASAARLSAMQTVQQRHLEAIRDCTNIGKLYAPAAAEADVNGCIATANPCGDAGMIHGPNFEASLVDSFGCVQTLKSNYAVNGSEAETNVQILDFVKARHIIDGLDETRILEVAANVEALPPVENNHAATKEYVDTVLAAGGGGGGQALTCTFTKGTYQNSTDMICESEYGAGWKKGNILHILAQGGLANPMPAPNMRSDDYCYRGNYGGGFPYWEGYSCGTFLRVICCNY